MGLLDNLTLLQGYNSVSGMALSNSAVRGSVSTPEGAGSRSIFSVCVTEKEVAESLSLDVSLTASYGPVDNLSAKTNFFNSLKVTQYSLHLIAYAVVTTGVQTATSATLTGAAPTADTLNAFCRTYGDSFINSITLGGEYFAAYSFYTETSQELETLQSDISGAGIVGVAKITADVASKYSKFLQTYTMKSRFSQDSTGQIGTALPANGSDAIAFAANFTGLKISSPIVTQFGWLGYETAQGMGDAFGTIVTSRQFFTGSNGIVDDLQALTQAQNQCTQLAAIYDTYNYTGDAPLIQGQKDIALDVSTINGLIEDFATNPAQEFTQPELKSLAYGNPSLSVQLARSGPWGDRPGGTPFDDLIAVTGNGDVSRYIEQMLQISQVQFRGDLAVNQIVVTYSSYVEGSDFSPQKQVNTSVGNGNGNLSSALLLQPQTFVSSITGYWYPEAVSGKGELQFLTITLPDSAGSLASSNDPTPQTGVYAQKPPSIPVKFVQATPINWTPSPNQFLVGFWGRAGTLMNELGIYAATLSVATWSGVAPKVANIQPRTAVPA